MPNNRCRICLEPLTEVSGGVHARCSDALFGTRHIPSLPYTWDELNNLAERAVRNHITVPGVQPKLSMHMERGEGRVGQGRLTIVGMEGHYIMKPPSKTYPEMPELEHLTMRMARRIGIQTAECGLISMEDGQLAYIARRMDRIGGHKLHMEDMCQLTDRLTDEKYRGSMEQVGKTVLRYSSNPLLDAVRLFERMVFCYLTGNADMHLKNFSLLHLAGGEIALSPAYDLLPTALLIPEDTEESALTIRGRKKDLKRDDFLQCGISWKLTEKQMDNVFRRFSSKIADAITFVGQGFCSDESKARFKGLMRDRSRCLHLAE